LFDNTSHSEHEDQKRRHSYQQHVQICMNTAIEHETKTVTSFIQAECCDISVFSPKLLYLRWNFARTCILPMPVAEAAQYFTIFNVFSLCIFWLYNQKRVSILKHLCTSCYKTPY